MSKGELKVTTYLVCSNPMLRAGLGHILANTRYEVREQEEPVSHSDERESAPRSVHRGQQLAGRPADRYRQAQRTVCRSSRGRACGCVRSRSDDGSPQCWRRRLLPPAVDALIRYLDLVMLGEMAYPSAHFLAAIVDAQGRGDRRYRSPLRCRDAPIARAGVRHTDAFESGGGDIALPDARCAQQDYRAPARRGRGHREGSRQGDSAQDPGGEPDAGSDVGCRAHLSTAAKKLE